MTKLTAQIGLLLAMTSAFAGEVGPIGYASVKDAYDALRADPTAEFSVNDGWTIVSSEEDGSTVLWSFTPNTHPAHPAAVKRKIIERDGRIGIDMKAVCGASKKACDALMEEFKELNEQMRQHMQGDT